MAEDLFQETLYRMMRSLDDYRPRAAFGTWLYTIARNLSLDHLKSQRIHREVSLDAPTAAEDKIIPFREILRSADALPDAALEKKEGVERIWEALKQLPPRLKEAVLLRVFHEMPYRDIAQVTRAPVGTVKYRVHEALGTMARHLGVERPSRNAAGDEGGA